MQRNLKASFGAMIAAAALAEASKNTVSLEAAAPAAPADGDPTDDAAKKAAAAAAAAADPTVGAADPTAAAPAGDPTEQNAPDTGDGDALAALDSQVDASATDPATTDLTADPDAVAAAAADPAADNTDGVGATDVTSGVAGDVPVDPTTGQPDLSADPLATSGDPVTDAMAAADAGTPPAATPEGDAGAAAGQGAEPTKIVVEVNVNGQGTGDAAAATADPAGTLADPAAAPAADGSTVNAGDLPANTPVQVVQPGDTATDGVAPVVTDPVAPLAVDGQVVDSTNPVVPADTNILSEEGMGAGGKDGVVVTKNYNPAAFDAEEMQKIDGQDASIMKDVKVVDETNVKIVELHGELDDYDKGFKAMDKIKEVLDTSAETGGIDDNGARILEIAYEHICDQLHISSATLGIPSMESFALPGQRISATTLALEDVKDTMAKVWAAIQQGWAKIVEWMGTFFQHLFSANAKLAEQATQIQAAASKLAQTAPVSTPVSNAGLAKKLASGSAVAPNIAQQLLALNNFAAGATNAAPALLKSMLDASTKISQLLRNPNADVNEIMAIGKEVEGTSAQFISALSNVSGMKPSADGSKFGIAAPAAGMALQISNVWLGNKVVYAYVAGEGEGGTGVGFRAGQATADVGEINPDMPALAPKDINAIAGLVLEYTKKAEGAKGYFGQFQEVSKLVLATGQAAAASNTLGPNLRNVFGVIKEMRAIASGIQQPAMAIAAGANAAALQYAALSLKAYSAPAAAPAAAAPAAPAVAAPAAA